MNCKEIIREYLVIHHYDGLTGDECACELDDLIPCNDNGDVMQCEPGYEVKGCTPDCNLGCDAHIVAGDRRKADRRAGMSTVHGRREIDDRRKSDG